MALALGLVLASVGCSSQEDLASTSAVVDRVGDGDTLEVRTGERVRLVQIDAPELGAGECYARESKLELEHLAPRDRHIELEADPALDDVDRYGRLLRYVVVADTNVNVELVRLGAAAPYFLRGERGRYAGELLEAVAEARAARRGMWGTCRVSWDPSGPVSTQPR